MPTQLPFHCYSQKCRNTKKAGKLLHLVEGESCPNCGQSHKLTRVETIHLLLPVSEAEHAEGRFHVSPDDADTGWKVACLPVKDDESVFSLPERFTTEPQAATCVECLELWKAQQNQEKAKP